MTLEQSVWLPSYFGRPAKISLLWQVDNAFAARGVVLIDEEKSKNADEKGGYASEANDKVGEDVIVRHRPA